jgi:hypothetical protein
VLSLAKSSAVPSAGHVACADDARKKERRERRQSRRQTVKAKKTKKRMKKRKKGRSKQRTAWVDYKSEGEAVPPLSERGQRSDSSVSSDEESDDDDNVNVPNSPPPLLPCSSHDEKKSAGLEQPSLDTGQPVTGKSKEQHRKENKWKRKAKQVAQGTAGVAASYWATHEGQFNIPTPKAAPKQFRGQMCPSGLALDHPAAQVLLDYAHGGCPVNTGAPWSREMMEAAIEKGPHVSAIRK